MRKKYLFLFAIVLLLCGGCEDPIDTLENNSTETNTIVGGGGSGETQIDTTEGEVANNGE